jgi:hypothetical protein
MFVSFYFELDQMAWPQARRRPKSFYLKNFSDVLHMIVSQGHSLLLFSNDTDMLQMCQGKAGVHAVKRELSSFWTWTQLDAIRNAMTPRWKRFSVPEFFSAEYVALQLCKFQALADASLLTMEPCIWIDSGLRLRHSVLQPPLLSQWTRGGIHVMQFAPVAPCESWVLEMPGAFLMGGCFGGFGPDVRRLDRVARSVLQDLWSRSVSANDQQLLSVLFLRMPTMFHTQKAFTTWVPWIGSGRWDDVLLCTTSETEERFVDMRLCVVSVLVFLILLLHKKR